MGRSLFRTIIGRSKNDHSAEAAAYNASHSYLYRLLPEILATINGHLPLESGLVLRLTCSKFYRSSVFNPTQQRADRTDLFNALCMLEHDGIVKGYCCRGCLKRHRYTAFSTEELAKEAHTRYCLETMKCFRAGLFREFSFAEIKKIYNVQVKRSVARRRLVLLSDRNEQGSLVSQGARIHMYCGKRYIYTKIYICRSEELFPSDRRYPYLVNLCKSINVPLCPHMTMGDDEVAELLLVNERNNHKCKRCRTKVLLHTGNEEAFFSVSRRFGKLSSPKDPTWLAHTYSSKDPLLETHCEAVHDWRSKNPVNSQSSLEQLSLLQHDKWSTPDFGNLFKRITLPRSRWINGFIEGGRRAKHAFNI